MMGILDAYCFRKRGTEPMCYVCVNLFQRHPKKLRNLVWKCFFWRGKCISLQTQEWLRQKFLSTYCKKCSCWCLCLQIWGNHSKDPSFWTGKTSRNTEPINRWDLGLLHQVLSWEARNLLKLSQKSVGQSQGKVPLAPIQAPDSLSPEQLSPSTDPATLRPSKLISVVLTSEVQMPSSHLAVLTYSVLKSYMVSRDLRASLISDSPLLVIVTITPLIPPAIPILMPSTSVVPMRESLKVLLESQMELLYLSTKSYTSSSGSDVCRVVPPVCPLESRHSGQYTPEMERGSRELIFITPDIRPLMRDIIQWPSASYAYPHP